MTITNFWVYSKKFRPYLSDSLLLLYLDLQMWPHESCSIDFCFGFEVSRVVRVIAYQEFSLQITLEFSLQITLEFSLQMTLHKLN